MPKRNGQKMVFKLAITIAASASSAAGYPSPKSISNRLKLSTVLQRNHQSSSPLFLHLQSFSTLNLCASIILNYPLSPYWLPLSANKHLARNWSSSHWKGKWERQDSYSNLAFSLFATSVQSVQWWYYCTVLESVSVVPAVQWTQLYHYHSLRQSSTSSKLQLRRAATKCSIANMGN